MSSSKKRSNVWQHFTGKGGKGVCRYCECEISLKNGNISNLSRHLKNKHPTVDRGRDSSVVFIQNEQPDNVTFELEEEDPTFKREPEVAASYRVRWTSKSELRERRRLRSADSRAKREIYLEPMDDAEEVLTDEIMAEDTRPVRREVLPKVTVSPSCDNDSDRHFLLSLLPLMKKLRPEDNMDIRIQIQNAFKEKLFPPKNHLDEIHTKNPIDEIIEEVIVPADKME